ncbi:hypothetical protein BKA82DRAFT_992323 [Pisolithus tinctorius]|uniref:Uncharacterized protein n=1 Tax=Pisolithus tinctorius Marx 270 TaxID=870435 RepID=A0A0C3JY61_PISTI|nr:hypothetical protein BKA82DRAFT_992323 [Pisolithus tinctorius]KIO14088.1 hypothetical protein M404DRAFT_992323 [Pisolithus tinctorius Marx 270]
MSGSLNSPYSKALAVVCVGAIALTAGSMYFAADDSKKEEGPDSLYREQPHSGQDDAKYHSSDVTEKLREPPLVKK